jgi:hypothetical protein
VLRQKSTDKVANARPASHASHHPTGLRLIDQAAAKDQSRESGIRVVIYANQNAEDLKYLKMV